MTRTSRLSCRCLALFAVALLVAGCAGKKATSAEKEADAFNDLRDNVQEVITDSDRAVRSLALVDKLQIEFDAIKQARDERRQQIRALNANYDASRAEFDELLNGIAQDRIANQQRVSRIYRQLLDVTTTEEWVKLAKSKSRAMRAAVDALQAI